MRGVVFHPDVGASRHLTIVETLCDFNGRFVARVAQADGSHWKLRVGTRSEYEFQILNEFHVLLHLASRLPEAYSAPLLGRCSSPQGRASLVQWIEGIPLFQLERRFLGFLVPLEMKENIPKLIAKKIALLHQCGVVHGDVRPENVLLTDHDTVELVDFGWSTIDGEYLAKSIDKIDVPGQEGWKLHLSPSPQVDFKRIAECAWVLHDPVGYKSRLFTRTPCPFNYVIH